MLRKHRQLRIQVQRLIDAGIFAAAFFLAHWLRTVLPQYSELAERFFALFGGTAEIKSFDQYILGFLFTIPMSVILLENAGFYSRPLVPSRRLTFWIALKVCTYVVIGMIILFSLIKVEIARTVNVMFGVLSLVGLLAKEELVRRWLLTNVGRAQLAMRIILVGSDRDREKLRADLEAIPDASFVIKSELDINKASGEELVEMLHEHSANGVVVSAAHTYFGQLEAVIQACELEGVQLWLCADFFKTQISQTSVDDFYGRPMLVFRSAPDISWQSIAKRALDFAGSFLLLVLLAVPLGLVALAIRMTSKGPILFRQERSGLNGHPFTMYKFRSMVTDAEQQKHELQQFNEIEGPAFKLSNDPRVTPLGKFLRKYSIDEMPQLYNVLRGEMSLVGPRPLPVDETKRFNDLAHRRRLSVKPGLTCLWQISGRSNVTDFKEWVRLDLEYIDNWSLWLDIRILVGTIPVVLAGAGAK